MKTIKIDYNNSIPDKFTGIAKFPDGTKYWYKERKLHREDGPAMEYPDGRKEWYKEGKLHREDGPAIIDTSGLKFWYKEGNFHREDGPAVELSNGTKYWYKEGKKHRIDGPACEYSEGRKEWHKEGKFHRLDGPAIEFPDGTKYWYIENNPYLPEMLSELINSCFYLGKEKGQYDLEWLKFLTENGIEEFPIIPGMKEYENFKEILNKLEV
jgi:hypothetical protein